MNDLLEVLKKRRTIRRYRTKDIPEETLHSVLDSVRISQSWANTQCWEVIVIRDEKIRRELQTTLPQGNPARGAMIAAPVVLAICGKLKSSGYYRGEAATQLGDWFMYDLGIATQNLCLTAWSQGLGTVVVGLFDHGRAREILGIPKEYELATLIPMGYPDHEGASPIRRAVEDFIHHDRF